MTVTKHITPNTLFEALKHIKVGARDCLFTLEKCIDLAPKINRINALKKEKNAIILAHSYVSPEIIHGVADVVGDSYQLSKKARETKADAIVFCAVKFMAETAKLLNPDKTVLIPAKENGCSLADAITGEQVSRLREQYPKHTFICYINTTAEVKAQCDICVTSSNVYNIIEKCDAKDIYFLPDKLMGENIKNEMKARGIEKNIDVWDGSCYVHEEYDPEMIQFLKLEYPGVEVVSHPECGPNVIAESDFVGSTSQMINHVLSTKKNTYFMLTECGLSTRLQLEHPEKTFVGSCTLCRYMKANTLDNILTALEAPHKESVIHIEKSIQEKALACINRMFDY